jgi:ribokinase
LAGQRKSVVRSVFSFGREAGDEQTDAEPADHGSGCKRTAVAGGESLIVNFGSLNIDYVYTMDHFVRPGETYTASDLAVHPGGKGLNQSIAIARAGGQVRHIGCIGREGQFLADLLAAEQVDCSGIVVTDGGNGHAIIQVDRSGENSIILFSGANRCQPAGFVQAAAAGLTGDEIVLFQNETDGIAAMMTLAGAKGCRIALNPAPMDARVQNLPLEPVDFLMVNEGEGAALIAAGPGLAQYPGELLERLAASYPSARILLTLGAQGMLFAWKSERLTVPAFQAGPAIDTTAAGDTFIGTYLALVDKGYTDADALRQASVAAGIAVTRRGAAESIPYRLEYAGTAESTVP